MTVHVNNAFALHVRTRLTVKTAQAFLSRVNEFIYGNLINFILCFNKSILEVNTNQCSNGDSIQNKDVDFIMPGFVRQNIPNLHKHKNLVNKINFVPLSLPPVVFLNFFSALESLASRFILREG